MKIKSLKLDHFRNYTQCQCQLDPKLNVFVGANAQGKTNLLESMAFLSSLRSFRNVSEQDLIQHDQPKARIQAVLSDEVMDKRLSILLSKQGKSLRYQNQLVRKSSEFIGLCNTVLFSPADMSFFDDSPRVRRRFFDVEAGKLSRLYLTQMVEFNKVLKERNALLKQPTIDHSLLEIFTGQLIKSQLPIIEYRRKMVDYLNQHLNKTFKKLSDTDLNLEIEYQEVLADVPIEQLETGLNELMKLNLDKDIMFKATQKGIHREDFVFKGSGYELSKIASQGQKRLTLLALRLTLIDFIVLESKTTPILLLDDVFSELDLTHQKKFLEACPQNVQTILTTTHLEALKDVSTKMVVFDIEGGTIHSRRIIHE